MKKYEILEHTGDIKIRAFGKTKEELFFNAMKGMMEVLKYEVRRPEEKIKRKISMSSPDLNALLVDFLSEVNYLIQTNQEIYDKIKFLKFSDQELDAKLEGYEVESFGEEIKAVTYHGLDIKQSPRGIWEATILFDI